MTSMKKITKAQAKVEQAEKRLTKAVTKIAKAKAKIARRIAKAAKVTPTGAEKRTPKTATPVTAAAPAPAAA